MPEDKRDESDRGELCIVMNNINGNKNLLTRSICVVAQLKGITFCLLI